MNKTETLATRFADHKDKRIAEMRERVRNNKKLVKSK